MDKNCTAQRVSCAHMILMLSLSMLMVACGSSDFGSVTGGKGKSTDGTGVKPNTPTPVSPSVNLTSLNWYWQCASDPGSVPAASGTNGVVQDGGEHVFSQTNFAFNVPVTMSGRLCPPAKYPRDIVLVIDVSGSMGGVTGNDKLKNGSCGRMAAVDSIISSVSSQGSDARFAIVTFSNGINAQSTAMFADKKSLYADIAGSKDLSSVLCDWDSGTNYGQGMSGAEKILSSSRSVATKEIYFISDGAPTDGTAGNTIADRLKKSGVSVKNTLMPVQVATVLLGNEKGGDTALQSLASVGVDTKPLYALATDASQLASTLSALAANDIDTGTIKYRPIGSTTWTEVSLKGLIKDYNFTIPAFNTSTQTAPLGLEASFEYRDLHSNVYTTGGTLKWQAK